MKLSELADWKMEREKGFLRYSLVEGMLKRGLVVTLATGLLVYFAGGGSLPNSGLILLLASFTPLGFVQYALKWNRNEKRYSKALEETPEVIWQ